MLIQNHVYHLHQLFDQQDDQELYASTYSLLQNNHNVVHQMLSEYQMVVHHQLQYLLQIFPEVLMHLRANGLLETINNALCS